MFIRNAIYIRNVVESYSFIKWEWNSDRLQHVETTKQYPKTIKPERRPQTEGHRPHDAT